jgi:hypothetical protein
VGGEITPLQSQAGMVYIFKMTVNQSSQTSAPANDTLQCQRTPPQHILVPEGDAGIRRSNNEVLTESGYQVDATAESIYAWQARLASNQHRMLRSAEHRLLFGV